MNVLVSLRTQRLDEYQSHDLPPAEGTTVRPVPRTGWRPARDDRERPDVEPVSMEDTQPRRTLAQHLFGQHREPRPGSTSTLARFGQAEAAAAGRRDLDLVGYKGVEFDRRGQRF